MPNKTSFSISPDEQKKYDWDGWTLNNNIYGDDFDLEARKRMIDNSSLLHPYLKSYESRLGDFILEVGPFFNPLITSTSYSDKNIFYWENDQHVLKFLSSMKKNGSVFPINSDLKILEGEVLENLINQTQEQLLQINSNQNHFNSIVISNVFNYIDYKTFLSILDKFMRPDSLVFINNTVNYGIPKLFSEKRPFSIEETVNSLVNNNYEILEKQEFESKDKKHQENESLIIVAKKK